MLFKILIALTMIPILGSSSHANWGSGLSQANPGCGVDNQIGDEAMGIKEELKEKELELKELKSDQRRIKSRTGSLRSSESSARESFKSSGFGDAAFNELETHVNSGASCSDYQGYCDYRGSAVSENETEAYPYWYVVWNFNPGQDGAEDIDAISSKRQPAADLGGQTPPVDDDGEPPPKPNPPRQEPPRPNPPVATEPPPPDYQRPPQEQPRNYPPRRPYSPPLVRACRDGSKSLSGFEPSSFLAHCGPGRGEVRDSICSKGVANEGMYAQNFNPSNCRKNLRNWLDKRKELRSLETELEDLDAKIRQLTEELRLGKKEYREAVKEHQRDLKDGTTEAGCVACDIRGAGGNGGGRQNSIWDTISILV